MNLVTSHKFEVDKVYSNPLALQGKLYEQFQKKYNESSTKKIEFVFHGTSAENVNNIFINGLDPKLRGTNGQAYGKGEYFSDIPKIPSFYAKNIGKANRIIIFAILKDPSVIVYDQSHILVVNDISYQLPLFVINFKNLPYDEEHSQTWKEIKEAPICQIPPCLLEQFSSAPSEVEKTSKKRKLND